LNNESKMHVSNNNWKFFATYASQVRPRQKLTNYLTLCASPKRQEHNKINIILLYRLGLITSKIFKKLYYFRVNNKKYLNRKYLLKKNYDSNFVNVNWENDLVNFDFLISNYYESSTMFTNESKLIPHEQTLRHCPSDNIKILSFDKNKLN
jgi:hypothetical protein